MVEDLRGGGVRTAGRRPWVAMVNQHVFAAVQADVAQKMAQKRGVAIREDQAGNIFLEVPSDPDAIAVNAAPDTPREVLLAPGQRAQRGMAGG